MWKINDCNGILDTMHFKHQGIYPVDLRDSRIQSEIQLFYPTLFEIFYQREKNERDDFEIAYTLPYVKRPVRVLDQILRENVATCLARVSRTYTIRQYFVSLAYYPYNEVEDDKIYFVFRAVRSSLPNALVVEALVEGVAVATNKLTRVEMNYLTKRWEYGVKRALPELVKLSKLLNKR